jgi:ankyrin repeat protein
MFQYICVLLFCAFHFVISCQEILDLHQYITNQKPAALHFSPAKMVVMSLEEWKSFGFDLPQIDLAIMQYHETHEFTQSNQNFLQHPNKYFNNRLQALANLIDSIPAHMESPIIDKLRRQAVNKQLYILALPPILDPRCIQADENDSFIFSDGLLSKPKALMIRDSYWAEFLDPLHRAGPAMDLYKALWKTSQIPNYFIFLDMVEMDPLLKKYAPQKHQVHYYNTPQERLAHRLTFKKGLAYRAGKLFDTSEFETNMAGKGSGIFILGTDGEFYANNYLRHQLQHSSEFAGENVISAGEIMAKAGKIIMISNKSGHYSPGIDDLLITLEALKAKMKSLKGIVVNVILAKGAAVLPIRAAYKASRFLATLGNTLCLSAQFRWTPLHIAVWRNQLTLAEEALQNCNIDAQNDHGLTALHLAVQGKSQEWIKLLLQHNASTSLSTVEGYTALHLAALQGDLEIINLLVPHSDISQKSNLGESVLHLAIKSGNLLAYHYFKELGLNSNETDLQGNGRLYYAIASGSTEMLSEVLLDCSPDEMFFFQNQGTTLLHIAAAFGTPQQIEFLQSLCIDPITPDITDENGDNLLHWATKYKNFFTFNYFLNNDYSTSISSPNKEGATPLHYAAAYLPWKTLKRFINYFENINPIDAFGETPLFYALRHGKTRNALLLINHGAHLHSRNTKGEAPIHISAASPYLSINVLLSITDDLLLLDNKGNTPLHHAIINNNHDCAFFLLPHMPARWLLHVNSDGLSPLDLADKLGNRTLFNKLIELIFNQN